MKLLLLLVAIIFQVANTMILQRLDQHDGAKNLMKELIDDGNRKLEGRILTIFDDSFEVSDCRGIKHGKDFFIKEYLLKGQTEIPKLKFAYYGTDSKDVTHYQYKYESSYYSIELKLVKRETESYAKLSYANLWSCRDEYFRFE